MTYLKAVNRMLTLIVYTNKGEIYFPLFGYDDQVEAYAPADEAIKILQETYNVDTGLA